MPVISLRLSGNELLVKDGLNKRRLVRTGTWLDPVAIRLHGCHCGASDPVVSFCRYLAGL